MSSTNNYLFSSPDVVVLGTHKGSNGAPKAELIMGDGIKLYFPMLNVSKGSQTDRIQVDVTLAGSINVSGGVNNGVGTYHMQFLDGPLVDMTKINPDAAKNKIKTAASQFLSARKLEDRRIKVKIFSSASSCTKDSASFSSKPIAEFEGVANTLSIDLSTDDSIQTVVTQIVAVGSWKGQ